MLEAMRCRSHVHKKGKINQPLSERSKKANTKKSKIRARVEHVFGSMTNEQGGLYFRVIGLARTKVKVGSLIHRIIHLEGAAYCQGAAYYQSTVLPIINFLSRFLSDSLSEHKQITISPLSETSQKHLSLLPASLVWHTASILLPSGSITKAA